MKTNTINRRNFIQKTSLITSSVGMLSFFNETADAKPIAAEDNIHIIGPKEGFSTHIGTMLSMMTWMRQTMLRSVTGLTKEQLDYLHDEKSNTIGAMLMHLAATETFYRIHTIENVPWGDWSADAKSKWDVPMRLGEDARKSIKGNNLDYYISALNETREKTTAEFRKKDDQWLMQIDPRFFGGKPTNNYCKWFHVCEHESNHNGQIKWIKGRLPGAKEAKE
jgi:uncharacterized damage-inducible protein DinB